MRHGYDAHRAPAFGRVERRAVPGGPDDERRFMRTIQAGGASIPVLGFGTFQMTGDDVVRMVSHALEVGYRHIDTAQAYRNEAEVGQGIQRSSVSRDDVFVTTKVTPRRFEPGDLQASVEESLSALQLDHVDLVLLHWPNPDVPLADTLGALSDVRKRGLTRHVGVSNFPTALLDEAVAASDVPLVTNQVEYHPFLSQRPVLDAVRRHQMTLTAYSPLARGRVLDDPVLTEIADGHGATPGQVALAWLLAQDDVAAIPKTNSEQRAEENLAALEVTLSAEEVQRISGLARPDGRIVNPDFAPRWDAA
jgi:diketogulonate reductase-like aldo/keto reductase